MIEIDGLGWLLGTAIGSIIGSGLVFLAITLVHKIEDARDSRSRWWGRRG